MYAPTGRGEKWVMNSEGVVLEYSSEPFHKADEIIAGINAHYGTSFYQEDDIDKDFTIGETMPSWNAYEKIEIPIRRIAANIASAPQEAAYIVGQIDGDTFKVMVDSFGGIITNDNGLITSHNGPTKDAATYIKNILSNFGIEVSNVQNELVDYEVNDYVPNWDKFEIFT